MSHLTNSGYFRGSYNCGAEIKGTFEDISCDNIIVTCTISPGKGLKCGKRYCRAVQRKQIGKHLVERNKAVCVYRVSQNVCAPLKVQIERKLMNKNDLLTIGPR